MASKGQMTGMLGVFLSAAELTHRGLIVSITSRNAKGADLLVTDQSYKKTWSIQVKTNRKAAGFWLMGATDKVIPSPTHVYIFVNLRGDARPDYYVVPSRQVAKLGRKSKGEHRFSLVFLLPGRRSEIQRGLVCLRKVPTIKLRRQAAGRVSIEGTAWWGSGFCTRSARRRCGRPFVEAALPILPGAPHPFFVAAPPSGPLPERARATRPAAVRRRDSKQVAARAQAPC